MATNDRGSGSLYGVCIAKGPELCVVDAFPMAGWDFDFVVRWIKNRDRLRIGWFQTSRSEFIVVGRKRNNDRQHRKCGPAWVQGSALQSRIHPTQKAVHIFVELIGLREDWQRTCDPFGGSGTAILAAEQMPASV